ncbi:MAG: HAMP domain-containing protein [Myxococcales bacterium]|nr:HAMP domain-containing protein [Myxococcales bacterium]
MRFSRVEKKIVVALLVVAVVPLVASVVLGLGALREAYRVGVNDRIGTQLDRGLDLYTDHLQTLRQYAERTAQAIHRDQRLVAALPPEGTASADHEALRAVLRELLREYDNVAEIRILSGSSVLASEGEEVRGDPASVRTLSLELELDGDRSVEVTTAAPWAPFRSHQRAAELVDVYRTLEEQTNYVTGTYLLVYMGLLFAVIVVVAALGLFLARRVTSGVLVLADATRLVGKGDLSVRVPVRSSDEIGELTDAFNHMVQDLQESQERIEYLQRIGAWQQFARRLAHEIKNPLTPIQLAVQEVHDSYRGGDEAYGRRLKEARAIVEEEVATLRRLVGEFSSFAKLPKAELAPHDLRELLSDLEHTAAAILDDEAPRHGWPLPRVMIDAPDTPLPVCIDAMMLKRCFDNLLRNAIQGCRNVADATVRVRSRREGAVVVVDVEDTGAGIPEEDRARVFDPYFTTKQDGTGLGLSIVKKVILEHGGEIECTAKDGGGARFSVTIPVANDDGAR